VTRQPDFPSGVPLGLLVVLLSAASGCADAFTFLDYQVFAANQTGNLVIVAISLVDAGFPYAVSTSVAALLGFVAGLTLALSVRARLRRSDNPQRLLLWLQAAVLLAAAGAFVAGLAALPMIALIAVSQGIQGVALTRVLDVGVRTVVVTGAILDVARLLSERKRARAVLAAAAPVGYALGAIAGAVAHQRTQVAAILTAVVFLAVSALMVARLAGRPGRLA
jgi:uncharacterized membrane protein YoaK (UPF0700 family)